MHQHSYRHDLEDNLICGCAFVFARINAHRHTGSLDGFGRVVRLVLPPFRDFVQLLFQSVLFVLREFQVFQPLLVLGFGQRRRLVVHKSWIDRSRGDQ